jgi:hypothetical protein
LPNFTQKRILILLLVLFVAVIIGCTEASAPDTILDEAEQLTAEAQAYIEQSQDELAERFNIPVADIELESITSPPEVVGTYIIMLKIGDTIYEYHGSNGEVRLMSETTTPANN